MFGKRLSPLGTNQSRNSSCQPIIGTRFSSSYLNELRKVKNFDWKRVNVVQQKDTKTYAEKWVEQQTLLTPSNTVNSRIKLESIRKDSKLLNENGIDGNQLSMDFLTQFIDIIYVDSNIIIVTKPSNLLSSRNNNSKYEYDLQTLLQYYENDQKLKTH